jgi:hypothetical protein
MDDLREEFRRDLQSFIFGETLSMRNGRLVIGNNLYKQWLNKIRMKGFDYEIDFKCRPPTTEISCSSYFRTRHNEIKMEQRACEIGQFIIDR